MTKLNQYQRRVQQRRIERIQSTAFLLTAFIVVVVYIIYRAAPTQEMYAQVLASGGTRSLADVQGDHLMSNAAPLMLGIGVLWLIILIVVSVINRQTYQKFDFDTPKPTNAARSPGFEIDLTQISPREFERHVAWLINQQTGLNTRVVGGGGDQGIDVEVYDAAGRIVGIVQCKRYDPLKALPPNVIREMATVRDQRGCKIAYVATTAYFTEESKRLAQRLNIRLIDGADLKRMIRKSVA
jgi:preprotein translocase subunit SecG